MVADPPSPPTAEDRLRIVKLGRRYTFRARHAVLELPEPWCRVHAHDYSVDVVFEGERDRLMVDHEDLDRVCGHMLDHLNGENLNDHFDHTSVESLADEFKDWLTTSGFEDAEVTVCEDGNRWATA